MSRKPFQTNYPSGTSHLVAGSLLNQQAAAMNAGALGHSIDGTVLQSQGAVDVTVMPMPGVFGQATITNDADTCDVDELGHVKPPCKSQHLYKATFKYFDGRERRWKDYGEELPLDAAGYGAVDDEEAGPMSEPVGGAIPSYTVGDIVACFWDHLRGALIPIVGDGGGGEEVTLDAVSDTRLQIPLTGSAIGNDQVAELYFEVKRGGIDQDWVVLAALSWRQPFIDKLRDWNDTRAGYSTFEAPHGTLIRFRAVHASINEPWIDRVEAMVWSIARVEEDRAEFVHRTHPSKSGGGIIAGFETRTDVKGLSDDSPIVTHNGQEWTITYRNTSDNWIMGINFAASIFNVPNEQTDDVCWTLITSIDCLQGDILEYCQRDFCFPAEIANRMTVTAEICVGCSAALSSQSSLSSLSSTLSTLSSLSSLSSPSSSSSVSSSSSTLSSSTASSSSVSSVSSDSTASSSSTESSVSSSTLSSLSSSSSSVSVSSVSSLSSSSTASSQSSFSTDSSLSSSSVSSESSSSSSLSSSSVSSESSSSSSSSASIGCSAECVWTWTAGSPDFWSTGVPCDDDPLGPENCTCDQPSTPGLFIGEVRNTPCYES